MPKMTAAQADAFLREVRVGVLAVERKANPPLTVPIWYDVTDVGDVILWMESGSLKAKLLRRAQRASFTVQKDVDGYAYVSIEGRVTFTDADATVLRAMAIRYLGEEIGSQYAQGDALGDAVLVTIHADNVRSFDFTD